MADTVMVRLPGDLAERIKAAGHKREPFVREAVEAALGDGRRAVAASRPSSGSNPSALPRAAATSAPVDHAMERQRKLNDAKYGTKR